MVPFHPTLSSQSIIKQTDARIWNYPMRALMAADECALLLEFLGSSFAYE